VNKGSNKKYRILLGSETFYSGDRKMESMEKAIEEVKQAMKNTKDKRMYERYQAVLLHLQGYPYRKIKQILNRDMVTVGNYVRAYKAKGLDGLMMGQSPGAPRKLSTEQEQEFYQTVTEKTPEAVGFPAEMNWTSVLIQQWVERKWGIAYTDSGIRRMLYRLGLTYTRSTYSLAKADPKQQEAFIQNTWEPLKKN
jgi:transposase